MAKNKKEETALVLRNDVYQSNPLVQARKKFDLMGMRLFFLGLRCLNPHFSEKDKYFDAEFKEAFIPTSMLTELFGGNTWYLGELKQACDKLFHAVVEFNYKDGGFALYHLFRKLEYVPNEGLYLRFEELLRPYILDLLESKGYTKINIRHLFALSSPYAIRLLELMLQYQNFKDFKAAQEIKRRFTIEELRFALNVPEESYNERIDNFRKFVIDIPIKEINKRTPYTIRYETVKEGRCVVAFDFTMDTFDVPVEELNGLRAEFVNDAVELLRSMGFSSKAAKAIYDKCDGVADCFARVNRAQALLDRQTEPVKNKLGFLRKAIEESWIGSRTESTELPLSLGGSRFGEWPKADKPQPKKRDVKIGKHKVPYGIAAAYMKHIRKGENIEFVNESLREFGVTIKEFTQMCENRGI